MLKPVLGSQIQLGHPLAKGLVGCWLMNEGAGNIVQDLSGNGHDGTLIADATWAAGKFGPCISVDSADDHIQIGPGDIFNLADQLTVSLWCKHPTGVGFITHLIAHWGIYNAWQIYWYTSEDVTFLVKNAAGTSKYGRYADGLADSNCHHIVGRYDGAHVSLWVDGVKGTAMEDAQTGNVKAAHSTEYMQIGGDYDTGISFGGLINNVMIYNRALSASEIAELYNNPFGMFEEEI